MGHKTTRREFLKQMALTGAAISGLPAAASAAEKVMKGTGGRSRVVIMTDKAVLKGENEIVQTVVDRMLDLSMSRLTGASSGLEAWKRLFGPDDVVGVKVNCLFGKGVSTHPEVTMAVVRGLKLAGVKPSNIIIWDRSTGDLIKSGYKPSKGGDDVQCVADDGDWGETIERGAFRGRISKIISEKVTAIVNVPILKTHGITGISCCLKNHYGSFDNPGNHHSNNCNPALADFNSIPMVVEKTRLVVVDAIKPQYDGGPGLKADAQVPYHSLMVSGDPLATDSLGKQIIEDMRKEKGLDAFSAAQVAWIESAQERGVGTCDPKKIELIKV